jgi:hypothetical protein
MQSDPVGQGMYGHLVGTTGGIGVEIGTHTP